VLPQLVTEGVGGRGGASVQMPHRNDLAERIDRDPEPECVRAVAQPRPQFVKLELAKCEIAQVAVMQRDTVLTSPCEPCCDGSMPMAKEAHCSGARAPFGQCGEHVAHPLSGGFEPLQWGMATGTEARGTGLAPEGLSAFDLAVRAVAREGVEVRIRDLLGRRTGGSDRQSPPWRSVWVLQVDFYWWTKVSRLDAARRFGARPPAGSRADNWPGYEA
jgi:hypothetical protein